MPVTPLSFPTGGGAAGVPACASGPIAPAPAALAAGPRAPAGPLRAATPRRLASAQLFDGAPEVEIAHGDALYRLRVTALGKLILTK